jgi:hypothetical protein
MDFGTAPGGDGGAIRNYGNLTLTEDHFSGNSAQDGGAIANVFQTGHALATLAIINSQITGNTAGEGGGVFNQQGSLTIEGCVINRNWALTAWGDVGWGGGVASVGANNLIWITSNSQVSDNYADGIGGGIYVDSGAIIKDTTIQSNDADDGGGNGGGIFASGGTLQLTNVTFGSNTAASGTAVYISLGVTYIPVGVTLNGDTVGP